jgi:hypothetical protein
VDAVRIRVSVNQKNVVWQRDPPDGRGESQANLGCRIRGCPVADPHQEVRYGDVLIEPIPVDSDAAAREFVIIEVHIGSLLKTGEKRFRNR